MKRLFGFSLLAMGLLLVSVSTAEAGGFGRSGRYGSRWNRGPVYHAPSVHYDEVYHETYRHWTPFRGWHSHGHVDVVPHYVPGHFDYRHGRHVHGNPHYHHDH